MPLILKQIIMTAFQTFQKELSEQNRGLNVPDSDGWDTRYVGIHHLRTLNDINFETI